MAIAPVTNGNSQVNGGTSNSASLNLPRPTGGAPGNTRVAVVAASGGTNRTITPPSGWQLLPGSRVNVSTTLALAVYTYAIPASGEPTQHNFQIDAASRFEVACMTYSDVNTASPESGTPTASTGTSGSTATAPVTATADADAWVVRAFAFSYSSSTSAPNFTAGTGLTEREESSQQITATGASQHVMLADSNAAQASGGNSTSATASSSAGTTTGNKWIGLSFALEPAAAAGQYEHVGMVPL